MLSLKSNRMIIISILISIIVLVEVTGTQLYAHYAVVGLVIYFFLAALLWVVFHYLRVWAAYRTRKRDKAEYLQNMRMYYKHDIYKDRRKHHRHKFKFLD